MNQKNTATASEDEHATAVGAVGDTVGCGGLVLDVVDLGRRQVEVTALATMADQLRDGDARRRPARGRTGPASRRRALRDVRIASAASASSSASISDVARCERVVGRRRRRRGDPPRSGGARSADRRSSTAPRAPRSRSSRAASVCSSSVAISCINASASRGAITVFSCASSRCLWPAISAASVSDCSIDLRQLVHPGPHRGARTLPLAAAARTPRRAGRARPAAPGGASSWSASVSTRCRSSRRVAAVSGAPDSSAAVSVASAASVIVRIMSRRSRAAFSPVRPMQQPRPRPISRARCCDRSRPTAADGSGRDCRVRSSSRAGSWR